MWDVSKLPANEEWGESTQGTEQGQRRKGLALLGKLMCTKLKASLPFLVS